jgi:hypothetical protein
MSTSEEKLLSVAIAAAKKGISYKIEQAQREDAESLVQKGLCFWSLDLDHISVYDLH